MDDQDGGYTYKSCYLSITNAPTALLYDKFRTWGYKKCKKFVSRIKPNTTGLLGGIGERGRKQLRTPVGNP